MVKSVVNIIYKFLYSLSQIVKLTGSVIYRFPLIFKNPDLTIRQIQIIGIGSIPLVLITGAFIGAETIMQANFQMRGLAPMRYLGYAVSKALITELAPVITCFVVSSRISTAIAAEIGSMKTTEQLDAMYCLSLDHIRYVILPKVAAAAVMMPVLVIFSELVGYLASVFIAYAFIDITMFTYLEGLRLFFYAPDMLIGIFKTSVFGVIIAISGSYFGLECVKGAEGIGAATTLSVMLSAILILVFDFIMALIFL
ncbi:MAG: ABC transporter permease [Chitinispirillales bacterium]|jgi:phospholipid/cholesterol/gamma-HCH transport system permease protein|nr:ABC transporter permease [Chitinispirillales bacterium]